MSPRALAARHKELRARSLGNTSEHKIHQQKQSLAPGSPEWQPRGCSPTIPRPLHPERGERSDSFAISIYTRTNR
jgi:hypothetical protein